MGGYQEIDDCRLISFIYELAAEVGAEVLTYVLADALADVPVDVPVDLKDFRTALAAQMRTAWSVHPTSEIPSEALAKVRAEMLRVEMPAGGLEEMRADLVAKLRANLVAVPRATERDEALESLRAQLRAAITLDLPAERQPETMVIETPGEADDMRICAEGVAQAWSLFGFFLPPHNKELLEYDLAEHRSDLFAALATAETRRQQNQLIISFTLMAIVKVLDRIRVALQNRLRDEFDWVAGRLPRN